MKHILFITAYGPSIINFRLSLIKKILSKGYKVSVAAPDNQFPKVLQDEIKNLGVDLIIFKISRTGMNLFQELRSLLEIFKIIRVYKPNIIISSLIKPIIYTGLVLKLFKSIRYFPLIAGIGYGLYAKNSIKHKILKMFIIKLYKEGIQKAETIIFQNKDDKLLFSELKIKNYNNQSAVINGSGVDLTIYPFSNLPKQTIFLMMSRLLVDKGVREYVEAAKIVRSKFPDVIFQLAGDLDENPESIGLEELNAWIDQGDIQYLGHIKYVQSILKNCKFFVLPSYREGTPRSTLEALATGRPIITTDVPGCRETVIHKKNGLLVPSKDHKALAKAMINFINEKDKNIEKMAIQSFLIAKNKYEINKVNQSIIRIINL